MPSLSLDWCLWEEGSILLWRVDCLFDSSWLQTIALRIHLFLLILGTWRDFFLWFTHFTYSGWGLCKWVCLQIHWEANSSKPDVVLCAQSPLAPPAHTKDGDPLRCCGPWLPPRTYQFFLLAARLLPTLWLCVLRLSCSASAGFLAAGLLSVSSCSNPAR